MASASSPPPLHMPIATPLPDIRRHDHDHHDQHVDGQPQHHPLHASPNSLAVSRTRRLELRNAGFRGARFLPRKSSAANHPPSTTNSPPSTTNPPLSLSLTCSSSSASAIHPSHSSDAENVSPSGRRARDRFCLTDHSSTRLRDTAPLQDITANASTTATISSSFSSSRNANRARPRVTSGKFWSPESSKHDGSGDGPQPSPPTQIQLSNSKSRSLRTRAKNMATRSRRSLSVDTRKYVDHLEAELAAAQSQLQAMNSPSVTREQSSSMRHLKAESRQLEEELEAWQMHFEDRVQEEMETHRQVELSLRARLRTLEHEADEMKHRIQELDLSLESTTEKLNATETANVQMEKRLEIMSELLAASPTKIDLHAQTPGRVRPGRPKSMLPRFPTAGSLGGCSPERHFPTSPTHSRFSPGISFSPVNRTCSPDVSSPGESSQSDVSGYSANGTYFAAAAKTRPMRRMRRFGAGSMGPKPLILPSTSHCEQMPASVPLLEHQRPESAFSFSRVYDSAEEGSPPSAHRRAMSDLAAHHKMTLAESPFPNFQPVDGSTPMVFGDIPMIAQHGTPHHEMYASFEQQDDFLLMSGLGIDPRSAESSQATTRNFDSLGSARGTSIGRNLMEELTAAQTSSDLDQASYMFEDREPTGLTVHGSSSPFLSGAEEDRPSSAHRDLDLDPRPNSSRFVSNNSTLVAVAPAAPASSRPKHRRVSSKPLGVQSMHSPSTLDSIRESFGDVFISPVGVAKGLVEAVQVRAWVPQPLVNVQWWLVGVLLGPMAKRRLLDLSSRRDQHLLQESSPPSDHDDDDDDDDDDDFDYGTVYHTPPPAPSNPSTRSLVAGKGKKRSPSISPSSPRDLAPGNCPADHHDRRWKHSPLLWLRFSMTLAIAVGIAFKDGPSSLLRDAMCRCRRERPGARRNAGMVGC